MHADGRTPRDPVRAQDAAAVLEAMSRQGVETVIIGGADTHGIMRGKRIPSAHVGRLLEEGMALSNVLFVADVAEEELTPRPDRCEGYFPSERDGYPDLFALPDPSTYRVVPWHPSTALMLADFLDAHHAPVPISPRRVLCRLIERARALGFEPYVGVELEFYVFREDADSVLGKRPADLVPLQRRASTYRVVRGSQQEPIGRAIREHMLAYGLPIEACNPETGPGQFEINLRFAPALEAADDAFLFKTAVKEVVAQQGLLATFMAKPNAAWAGSSCHIHVSLRKGDAAAFHDPDGAHEMSATMRHSAGGMLATMPELTSLFAPTVNSYKRFRPYSWAATTATWGVDNRSTALRAVCETADAMRIEHRQAGGDANPYLVVAGALAGCLVGIERALEPPALVQGDAYALSQSEAPPLPRSLAEATALLRDSELAAEYLGHEFVEHYVAMKDVEIAAWDRAVTDWEINRYADAL